MISDLLADQTQNKSWWYLRLPEWRENHPLPKSRAKAQVSGKYPDVWFPTPGVPGKLQDSEERMIPDSGSPGQDLWHKYDQYYIPVTMNMDKGKIHKCDIQFILDFAWCRLRRWILLEINKCEIEIIFARALSDFHEVKSHKWVEVHICEIQFIYQQDLQEMRL